MPTTKSTGNSALENANVKKTGSQSGNSRGNDQRSSNDPRSGSNNRQQGGGNAQKPNKQ